MKNGLHYPHWFKAGVLSLQILGLTTTAAIAQAPPDVVIDSDPGAGNPSETVPSSNDPRFVCQMDQGTPTVMYLPESQPGQTYAWAVPQSMGGGWSAERRCTEIARRLETYRGDGLVELTTGRENNYDIVCVTTEANNSCQIVFTVPQGQNAIATRDSVFDNLASADAGTQTQGVTTFTGSNSGNNNILGQIGSILGGFNRPSTASTSGFGSTGINLKPFLSPQDGGTGTNLRQGTYRNTPPASPGRTLNPNLFR